MVKQSKFERTSIYNSSAVGLYSTNEMDNNKDPECLLVYHIVEISKECYKVELQDSYQDIGKAHTFNDSKQIAQTHYNKLIHSCLDLPKLT